MKYATTNSSFNLCDLLDQAFGQVSRNTQMGKYFMKKQAGRDAQLMAISYSNADKELPTTTENDTSKSAQKKRKSAVVAKSEPAQKKRKVAVGTDCMNLHFANLVDDQLTDVMLYGGKLEVNGELWEPWCRFLTIEEDLLLYLAVLGGKTYSGYYNHPNREAYSTRHIFMMNLKGKGFSIDGNRNAVKNDSKTFENMVAHMIFCASRRNGVQGIPFNDFFAGLLGEFQDEFQAMMMTIGDTNETIVASKYLTGTRV